MEKNIITTKGTNGSYVTHQLITDLFYVIIGVFCAQKVEPLRDNWQFSAANTVMTASIICFFLAFLSVIYHVMVATTIAEVSNGTISGKGLQGISVKSFQLRFDQVSSITTSKGFLNIETGNGAYLIVNTTSGNYKVITSPNRANEIMELFNSYKQ